MHGSQVATGPKGECFKQALCCTTVPEVDIFEMSSEKEVPILVFVGRHHTGPRAVEGVRELLSQDFHAGGK